MKTTIILLFISLSLIDSLYSQISKPPYPIVFVHGWAGSETAWTEKDSDDGRTWEKGNWKDFFESKFNWKFGGYLDICLENSSETLLEPFEKDISNKFTFNRLYYHNPEPNNPLINKPDFYIVNFDVKSNGLLNLETTYSILVNPVYPVDSNTTKFKLASDKGIFQIAIGDIIQLTDKLFGFEFMEFVQIEDIDRNDYSITVKRGFFGTDKVNWSLIIDKNEILSDIIIGKNLSNLSSQAAIKKGGIGVKMAINKVIELTKAEKVIIISHSMGGLNCREFIQGEDFNRDLPNVAKLLTINTPHKGSNSSDVEVIQYLKNYLEFEGYDLYSDAVRDLRISTIIEKSVEDSPYLFGNNIEENSVDYTGIYFYRKDINCDGVVNQNHIIGLNNKTWPSNVLFHCIVGNWIDAFGNDILGTDQVVQVSRQIPPLSIPFTFSNYDMTLAEASNLGEQVIHNAGRRNIKNCMLGLDEPNTIGQAYSIQVNQLSNYYINGFTLPYNYNPNNANEDYDFYKFTADKDGKASIDVYEIYNTNYWEISAYENISGESLISEDNTTNPGSEAHLTFDVVKGKEYYFSIASNSLEDSYLHPYRFRVTTAPIGQLSISAVKLNKPAFTPGEEITLNVTLANNISDASVTFIVDGSLPISCNSLGEGKYQAKFNALLQTGKHLIKVFATKTGYVDATPYETSYEVAGAGFTVKADPTEIVLNQSSSEITASLTGPDGKPMPGINVNFLQSPTGESITQKNVTTDANGIASTYFTPDIEGPFTIKATAQTVEKPAAYVQVKVGTGNAGTFNIKLSSVVTNRTNTSTTIELDPYVTFTSNGLPIEDTKCIVTTNTGTFQNSTQTYTETLGNSGGPGRLWPIPILTVTENGTVQITITVGKTVAVFKLPVTIGPVPVIQSFYSLTDGTSTDDTEHELDWSSDGKLFAYTPRRIIEFPSFKKAFSGPNAGNARSLSFSKTGQNLVMGRAIDNPVFYIYNIASKTLNNYNPSNTLTNSIVWSKDTDEKKFALANSSAGYMNQIIVYTGDGLIKSYLTIDGTTDIILSIDWKGNYLAAATSGGCIYSILRPWAVSGNRQ